MLNCIKFDLFKVFKSKLIWIITAISFAVDMAVLITYFVVRKENGGILQCFASIGNSLELIIVIFTALFVCKDFSSGYVKNFYLGVSKVKYVLSKFVVVTLYVIAYQLVYFLLLMLFVCIFGSGKFINVIPGQIHVSIGEFAWHQIKTGIFITISLINMGFVVIFFSFLFKREYVCFLVILSWILFLQGIFIGLISDFLSIMGVIYFNLHQLRVLAVHNDYQNLIPSIMAIIAAATSILWSYLLYRKKKI